MKHKGKAARPGKQVEEAPVWLPRDTSRANYVQKHKQRDKGLEVVFDPKGHK